MRAQNFSPRSRHQDLVVEHVRDEILIYDLERDQASCLNRTAALVWQHADGKTSVSEIAEQVARDLNAPVSVQVVWYALDQLSKKNLLQERAVIPPEYTHLTRRDFLVKAGLVGAAVAIPAIISLTAPTTAMAATCTPSLCPTGTECGTGCHCNTSNHACIPN
ncbi:MAG TPA: PqqD family protein [Anaerolineae bacterium]|nr:PqqD family protein [Anaerolineae bacterium]